MGVCVNSLMYNGRTNVKPQGLGNTIAGNVDPQGVWEPKYQLAWTIRRVSCDILQQMNGLF